MDLFSERWLHIPCSFCHRWAINSWISLSFCSLGWAQDLKNWVRRLCCLPPSVLVPWVTSLRSLCFLCWGCFSLEFCLFAQVGVVASPGVLNAAWASGAAQIFPVWWLELLLRGALNLGVNQAFVVPFTSKYQGFWTPCFIRTNTNYTLQSIGLGTIRVFLTKHHLQFFQPYPAFISCRLLPSR